MDEIEFNEEGTWDNIKTHSTTSSVKTAKVVYGTFKNKLLVKTPVKTLIKGQ